jgi:hypothetical protein
MEKSAKKCFATLPFNHHGTDIAVVDDDHNLDRRVESSAKSSTLGWRVSTSESIEIAGVRPIPLRMTLMRSVIWPLVCVRRSCRGLSTTGSAAFW